jgi:hypothetical protein
MASAFLCQQVENNLGGKGIQHQNMRPCDQGGVQGKAEAMDVKERQGMTQRV